MRGEVEAQVRGEDGHGGFERDHRVGGIEEAQNRGARGRVDVVDEAVPLGGDLKGGHLRLGWSGDGAGWEKVLKREREGKAWVGRGLFFVFGSSFR